MRRYVLLFLVTVFLALFMMIGIRLNWGRGTILPKPKSSKPDPIFWQKVLDFELNRERTPVYRK
jgi:hypothetical protein